MALVFGSPIESDAEAFTGRSFEGAGADNNFSGVALSPNTAAPTAELIDATAPSAVRRSSPRQHHRNFDDSTTSDDEEDILDVDDEEDDATDQPQQLSTVVDTAEFDDDDVPLPVASVRNVPNFASTTLDGNSSSAASMLPLLTTTATAGGLTDEYTAFQRMVAETAQAEAFNAAEMLPIAMSTGGGRSSPTIPLSGMTSGERSSGVMTSRHSSGQLRRSTGPRVVATSVHSPMSYEPVNPFSPPSVRRQRSNSDSGGLGLANTMEPQTSAFGGASSSSSTAAAAGGPPMLFLHYGSGNNNSVGGGSSAGGGGGGGVATASTIGGGGGVEILSPRLLAATSPLPTSSHLQSGAVSPTHHNFLADASNSDSRIRNHMLPQDISNSRTSMFASGSQGLPDSGDNVLGKGVYIPSAFMAGMTAAGHVTSPPLPAPHLLHAPHEALILIFEYCGTHMLQLRGTCQLLDQVFNLFAPDVLRPLLQPPPASWIMTRATNGMLRKERLRRLRETTMLHRTMLRKMKNMLVMNSNAAMSSSAAAPRSHLQQQQLSARGVQPSVFESASLQQAVLSQLANSGSRGQQHHRPMGGQDAPSLDMALRAQADLNWSQHIATGLLPVPLSDIMGGRSSSPLDSHHQHVRALGPASSRGATATALEVLGVAGLLSDGAGGIGEGDVQSTGTGTRSRRGGAGCESPCGDGAESTMAGIISTMYQQSRRRKKRRQQQQQLLLQQQRTASKGYICEWLRELVLFRRTRHNIRNALFDYVTVEKQSHAMPLILPNGTMCFSRWHLVAIFVRTTDKNPEDGQPIPNTSRWIKTGYLGSHVDTVTSMKYDATLNCLFTSSFDGTIKRWGLRDELRPESEYVNEGLFNCVASYRVTINGNPAPNFNIFSFDIVHLKDYKLTADDKLPFTAPPSPAGGSKGGGGSGAQAGLGGQFGSGTRTQAQSRRAGNSTRSTNNMVSSTQSSMSTVPGLGGTGNRMAAAAVSGGDRGLELSSAYSADENMVGSSFHTLLVDDVLENATSPDRVGGGVPPQHQLGQDSDTLLHHHHHHQHQATATASATPSIAAATATPAPPALRHPVGSRIEVLNQGSSLLCCGTEWGAVALLHIDGKHSATLGVTSTSDTRVRQIRFVNQLVFDDCSLNLAEQAAQMRQEQENRQQQQQQQNRVAPTTTTTNTTTAAAAASGTSADYIPPMETSPSPIPVPAPPPPPPPMVTTPLIQQGSVLIVASTFGGVLIIGHTIYRKVCEVSREDQATGALIVRKGYHYFATTLQMTRLYFFHVNELPISIDVPRPWWHRNPMMEKNDAFTEAAIAAAAAAKRGTRAAATASAFENRIADDATDSHPYFLKPLVLLVYRRMPCVIATTNPLYDPVAHSQMQTETTPRPIIEKTLPTYIGQATCAKISPSHAFFAVALESGKVVLVSPRIVPLQPRRYNRNPNTSTAAAAATTTTDAATGTLLGGPHEYLLNDGGASESVQANLDDDEGELVEEVEEEEEEEEGEEGELEEKDDEEDEEGFEVEANEQVHETYPSLVVDGGTGAQGGILDGVERRDATVTTTTATLASGRLLSTQQQQQAGTAVSAAPPPKEAANLKVQRRRQRVTMAAAAAAERHARLAAATMQRENDTRDYMAEPPPHHAPPSQSATMTIVVEPSLRGTTTTTTTANLGDTSAVGSPLLLSEATAEVTPTSSASISSSPFTTSSPEQRPAHRVVNSRNSGSSSAGFLPHPITIPTDPPNNNTGNDTLTTDTHLETAATQASTADSVDPPASSIIDAAATAEPSPNQAVGQQQHQHHHFLFTGHLDEVRDFFGERVFNDSVILQWQKEDPSSQWDHFQFAPPDDPMSNMFHVRSLYSPSVEHVFQPVVNMDLDGWKLSTIDVHSTVMVFDLENQTHLFTLTLYPAPHHNILGSQLIERAITAESRSRPANPKYVVWGNSTMLVSPLPITSHTLIADFSGEFLDAHRHDAAARRDGRDGLRRRKKGEADNLPKPMPVFHPIQTPRGDDRTIRVTIPTTSSGISALELGGGSSSLIQQQRQQQQTSSGLAFSSSANLDAHLQDSSNIAIENLNNNNNNTSALFPLSGSEIVYSEETPPSVHAKEADSAQWLTINDEYVEATCRDHHSDRHRVVSRMIQMQRYPFIFHILYIFAPPVVMILISIFIALLALRLDGILNAPYTVPLAIHFLLLPHYFGINVYSYKPLLAHHSGASFHLRILADILYLIVFPVTYLLRMDGHWFTSMSWVILSSPLSLAIILAFIAARLEDAFELRHLIALDPQVARSRYRYVAVLQACQTLGIVSFITVFSVYFDDPLSLYTLATSKLSIFVVFIPIWMFLLAYALQLPSLVTLNNSNPADGQIRRWCNLIVYYGSILVVFAVYALVTGIPVVGFCFHYDNYYECAMAPDGYLHNVTVAYNATPVPAANSSSSPPPPLLSSNNGTNLTANANDTTMSPITTTTAAPEDLQTVLTRSMVACGSLHLPLIVIVTPVILGLLCVSAFATTNVITHIRQLRRGQ